MLETLDIKNWVLVKQLSLEFQPNMTVLTGETGAGKSILIDALNIVLGAAVDKIRIRYGEERAEITACFDIQQNSKVKEFLLNHQLEAQEDCILRRILVRNGRSRCYINNTVVPRALLVEIGEYLLHIHGQHAHQSLLKATYQRSLLDAWGGHQGLLKKVSQTFKQWQQHQQALTTLQQQGEERLDRIDLLIFQAQELANLNPQAGEFEQLSQEQKQLANAEQVLTICQQSLDLLSDQQPSAHQKILQTVGLLTEIKNLYPILSEVTNLLNEALIQIEEAEGSLIDLQGQVDLDPKRLQQVDQQLMDYLSLSKKFRCEPEQLIEKQEEINNELALLENTDEQLAYLQQAVKESYLDYQQQAKKLSQKRQKSAKKLAQIITQSIQELSMQGGVFEISCQTVDNHKISALGTDQIQFLVSANAGQPVQPLNKVASGGELSRISLAIQVASADYNPVATLIFDEVDVGIGGGVAEIVGQRLRELAQFKQVLCVTHLPQVASQGHQHWMVAKSTQQKQTTTHITPVTGKQRIKEIARMLGGIEITKQSLAHAEEMMVL